MFGLCETFPVRVYAYSIPTFRSLLKGTKLASTPSYEGARFLLSSGKKKSKRYYSTAATTLLDSLLDRLF